MAKGSSPTELLETRNGEYDRPANTRPGRRRRTKAPDQSNNDSNTPAKKTPQRSAAEEVFHVFELVEFILLYLDPKDITNVILVNKYIRSVAEQFKPLLQHVAGPLPPGLEVIWKVHERTSIEAITTPINIHIALASRYKNGRYPAERKFYIIPLIPNLRLLRSTLNTHYLKFDKLGVVVARGQPGDPPTSAEHRAFIHLYFAPFDSFKLPAISSFGPECFEMFFTEPPATMLHVQVNLPLPRIRDWAGRWTYPNHRRPYEEYFKVERNEGVRLRDVVSVVEKADAKWIEQLRKAGGVVRFPGEKNVLVGRDLFDFVKEKGTIRM